ncbi:DUF3168 domain-containing protein [Oceanicella sp. SM1341]|uniref:DUF3168 domain-containing protein n=1 Tax=Oceanicella sp. SM1341 TaxID=1548889 RepID=UPI000E516B92|nr:DUF3168 domain-containing protein [Oceanicella sp. SM1341]
MTYAMSWALQKAVFARLSGDTALGALVGGAIHDAPPHAARSADPLAVYVTLGDETARAWDTADSHGCTHDFDVTVHSGAEGFAASKEVAEAVCDALVDADLALERGHLVALRFVQARAQRGRSPEKRRITLRFRAVIEDT